MRIIDRAPEPNPLWSSEDPDPASSFAPYRLYNIGNQRPIQLMDFIAYIEEGLGQKAAKNLLPAQPGEVPATLADASQLQSDFGFTPATPISEGIRQFVAWYAQLLQSPLNMVQNAPGRTAA